MSEKTILLADTPWSNACATALSASGRRNVQPKYQLRDHCVDSPCVGGENFEKERKQVKVIRSREGQTGWLKMIFS